MTRLAVVKGRGALDGEALAGRSVEDSVIDELETLPAAGERSGVAAACLSLARVLDDETAVPQHPSAARALSDLLGKLRAEKSASSGGKLGELRASEAARRGRDERKARR
ncbi:hypothetical protein [Georgenia wangjunii]|uniref:hypothetical protein n=1 Tax=Georgenia wangjunii TaxID=3117730 RepID=UPI002F2685AD